MLYVHAYITFRDIASWLPIYNFTIAMIDQCLQVFSRDWNLLMIQLEGLAVYFTIPLWGFLSGHPAAFIIWKTHRLLFFLYRPINSVVLQISGYVKSHSSVIGHTPSRGNDILTIHFLDSLFSKEKSVERFSLYWLFVCRAVLRMNLSIMKQNSNLFSNERNIFSVERNLHVL